LRAVVAELAERGTPASYGAVWRFFKHAGITFKKNSARQRAGSRHFTTLATLTPNSAAVSRQVRPPDTERTTRSRRSCE
jgi:hypothetical protein